ncbi:MAG TPA: hypothetical protein VIN71_05245 [Pseudomonadales bacterium]
MGTGIKILAAVDMVLGPLLTFLVYRPGKKGLKLDLAVIALCQFAALAYGLHSIHASRPTYLVFYGDTFYLADNRQIDQKQLADPSLSVGLFGQPKVVVASIPGTNQERFLMAMEQMEKGRPIQFSARYLTDFREIDSKTLQQQQLSTASLKKSADRQLAQRISYYESLPGYALFHLLSHVGNMIAVVDIEQRQIIDVLATATPE